MNEQMKMFIECHVPIKACNFKCEYCYVTQNGWWKSEKPDFSYCLESIDKAFAKERLGGTCMINLCATGETLLYPEMVEVIHKLLLCGHYVMVVTNGTLTQRFEEIAKFPSELKEHLFFKFSFHYLELLKLKMLDKYFKNVHFVQDNGMSFTVEITPDDGYIPYIPEIKKVCMENLGSLCHVTVSRDERKKEFPLLSNLPMDEFINTWKDFDSGLFDFKSKIFGVKRKEFCYAGKWSIVLELGTGEYSQCYHGNKIGNFYKNTNKPPKLYPVGKNCRQGHCFNGHAFLGFGLIPGLDTMDYADMRNRKPENGKPWLRDEMEAFMRKRLIDTNQEDTSFQKWCHNIKSKDIIRRAVRKVIKH